MGRPNKDCPALKVHGRAMQNCSEETYLGDIISLDGKNTKNIKSHTSKGLGIISQIFNILDCTSFSPHNFEIALLLRDSMLINGTLYNAEIWYNMTESDINELQNLDNIFFSRLLGVPKSTPTETFHLELGVLLMPTIIKASRILFA